jgi:hypothetical protein
MSARRLVLGRHGTGTILLNMNYHGTHGCHCQRDWSCSREKRDPKTLRAPPVCQPATRLCLELMQGVGVAGGLDTDAKFSCESVELVHPSTSDDSSQRRRLRARAR